jgi:transcriptional regulator with XRE-family HTH domain
VSTNTQRSQILARVRNDKEYRDLFVAEQIFSRLPLKIRIMRKSRKMKQRELAQRAGVTPEWITQVENPNYGRFTLRTLLKIAAAFDVGLSVDFVPYSKVLNDTLNLAPNSFQVPSSHEDAGLWEAGPPQTEAERKEPAIIRAISGVFSNMAGSGQQESARQALAKVFMLQSARKQQEEPVQQLGLIELPFAAAGGGLSETVSYYASSGDSLG